MNVHMQGLLGLLPTPSVRVQRYSLTCLQGGLALMAFVSLNPYFLWSYQKPLYGVATLIVVASAIGSFPALVLGRARLSLSLAFSLFLVYLSFLPKVEGSPTRWFFLIPFTVALLHLRRTHLRAAFETFHWLFALSLVPGMLLWAWILAGLPVDLRFMIPPGDIVQRGVTEYLQFPGAVFLMANGVVLPNDGVLFRLCGIYDEPGTVGTIAALCLAASRFQLGTFRGAVSFIAGAMSLSLAFAVLTTVGLIATGVSARRLSIACLAVLTFALGLVPGSGLMLDNSSGLVSNVTVVTYPEDRELSNYPHTVPAPRSSSGSESQVTRERFVPHPQWGLRNSPELDNRAIPRMRKLLDDYWQSPPGALLFGIASDASVVYGWGSSVWYRVLTDFGIVGFLWLFALFSLPLIQAWRQGSLDAPTLIFCFLFLMSFYQRPIIWLPAQLLIYMAGVWGTWGQSPEREKVSNAI